MRLKIRTQAIETLDGTMPPAGFSVIVEDADTGDIIPYVQKFVLEMDVGDFATATITVAGVMVEGNVVVNGALTGIHTRPAPADLLDIQGAIQVIARKW